MPQDLQPQWRPYERLVPYDMIAEKIEFVRHCIQESAQFIIPSFILQKDGPVVSSVFLVTESYICEMRIHDKSHEFDVSLLGSILNYKLSKGPSKDPQRPYEVAEITLTHEGNIASSISYVGESRDEWLRAVLAAIPIDVLSKCLSARPAAP